MEARSLSQPLSSQTLAKVREYKADCGKLQQQVHPVILHTLPICRVPSAWCEECVGITSDSNWGIK